MAADRHDFAPDSDSGAPDDLVDWELAVSTARRL
ncbi:MAG: hypothetical protein QOK30_713, partial [Nocardioidaceae bacterium]|nr:hypothetical protein [Nocardioidaceae bacterium]